MSHLPSSQYIPGICNIGPSELQAKTASAFIGLILSLLVAAYAFTPHVSPVWKFALFLPITFTVLEFLQLHFKFCVNYGLRGVFNTNNHFWKTEKVPDIEFCVQDKSRAQMIILLSVFIGAVLTTTIVLV